MLGIEDRGCFVKLKKQTKKKTTMISFGPSSFYYPPEIMPNIYNISTKWIATLKEKLHLTKMFPWIIFFFILWEIQLHMNKFNHQRHTEVHMKICPLSLPPPGTAEPCNSDSSKSACLSCACMKGLSGRPLLIVLYEWSPGISSSRVRRQLFVSHSTGPT